MARCFSPGSKTHVWFAAGRDPNERQMTVTWVPAKMADWDSFSCNNSTRFGFAVVHFPPKIMRRGDNWVKITDHTLITVQPLQFTLRWIWELIKVWLSLLERHLSSTLCSVGRTWVRWSSLCRVRLFGVRLWNISLRISSSLRYQFSNGNGVPANKSKSSV